MKKNFNKVFWFSGGFAVGMTLISLGHAAIPKRVLPQTNSQTNQNTLPNMVSEMKAPKVTAPDLEQDYAKLSNLEARYAESWEQQQRLRAATSNVAQSDYRSPNPAPVKTKKKVRQ
jgi:hypothetical protein